MAPVSSSARCACAARLCRPADLSKCLHRRHASAETREGSEEANSGTRVHSVHFLQNTLSQAVQGTHLQCCIMLQGSPLIPDDLRMVAASKAAVTCVISDTSRCCLREHQHLMPCLQFTCTMSPS